MIGILIIAGASWLLLFLLEKKHLSVLGFTPVPRKILQFFLGFGFIVLIQGLLILIETFVLSIEWEFNTSFDLQFIFSSLWYHTKSALTEDLIFRGAALYLIAERFSNKTAIITSAVFFGIYHWFSYGMFGGGLIPMIYIFLITGTTGAVWAYSYFKTNSIFMALGFHIAWNFVSTLFFDNQPFGELLFQQMSLVSIPNEWISLIYQLGKGLAPSLITYLFIHSVYNEKEDVNPVSLES